MKPFVVRPATLSDASAAVELLRESITQLCIADHQNDPATLARWLQNKTTGHLERWINDPDNFVVVAEMESLLAGIGLINVRGNIHLCYVRPGRTRSGIGAAILGRLETEANRWGLSELRLTSTLNARSFYECQGYLPVGEASHAFGVLSEYPYRKTLRDSGVSRTPA